MEFGGEGRQLALPFTRNASRISRSAPPTKDDDSLREQIGNARLTLGQSNAQITEDFTGAGASREGARSLSRAPIDVPP